MVVLTGPDLGTHYEQSNDNHDRTIRQKTARPVGSTSNCDQIAVDFLNPTSDIRTK